MSTEKLNEIDEAMNRYGVLACCMAYVLMTGPLVHVQALPKDHPARVQFLQNLLQCADDGTPPHPPFNVVEIMKAMSTDELVTYAQEIARIGKRGPLVMQGGKFLPQDENGNTP